MNKAEFKNLKVGDIVILTVHGQNYGKKGIVKEIHRDCKDCETAPLVYQGGMVYLESLDCEFVLPRGSSRKNKDGLYRFRHEHINYPKLKKENPAEHRPRITGWILAFSKQEAIATLEVMLERMKKCSDDVDMVNMYIHEDELK